ncbi:MAG: hypothetical protein H6741_20875 [Alphaproteobacteria bacterium]|nr:hypothetical protein [Alphaproteobacteria bacterium]
MLLLLLACRTPGTYDLVHAEAWVADAEADPFPAHAEGRTACEDFLVEEGILEVDTGACPYFVVSQPARVGLRAGDRVEGGVVWDTLYAEDPGVAHLALAVNGEPVWELEVEIPGEPSWAILDEALPVDLPEGADLVWHLHNHGVNQWRFLSLEGVVE